MRREYDPRVHATRAQRVFRRIDKPFSALDQARDFIKVMWPHLCGFILLFVVLSKISPS